MEVKIVFQVIDVGSGREVARGTLYPEEFFMVDVLDALRKGKDIGELLARMLNFASKAQGKDLIF